MKLNYSPKTGQYDTKYSQNLHMWTNRGKVRSVHSQNKKATNISNDYLASIFNIRQQQTNNASYVFSSHSSFDTFMKSEQSKGLKTII